MGTSGPRGWIALAAASFLGYFSLLVYCDIFAPGYPGCRFAWRRGRPVIAGLQPGSPADRARLAAGDILYAIDGHPIAGRLDLEAREQNVEFGRARMFDIERGGTPMRLAVTVNRA